MELRRDLGITQESPWHLPHRVRDSIFAMGVKFDGQVEVDEPYFRGKQKNKDFDKNLNAGRGAVS
ncbi:MAG: hypothetical protein OXL40_10165 [Bacteroidota bacterium]|nr:hypothetical protein [Bacteroidota bacterium]